MKLKYICLGMQKNATTSVRELIKAQGLKVSGPDFLYDTSTYLSLIKSVDNISDRFDALQDSPWPMHYKLLYSKYPNCKYFLTYRDPERWWASMNKHFSGEWTPLRAACYGIGDPDGRKELYLNRYNNHNRDTKTFFNGLTNFISLNIEDPTWQEELSEFLFGNDQAAANTYNVNTESSRNQYRRTIRGRMAQSYRFVRNKLVK